LVCGESGPAPLCAVSHTDPRSLRHIQQVIQVRHVYRLCMTGIWRVPRVDELALAARGGVSGSTKGAGLPIGAGCADLPVMQLRGGGKAVVKRRYAVLPRHSARRFGCDAWSLSRRCVGKVDEERVHFLARGVLVIEEGCALGGEGGADILPQQPRPRALGLRQL
jgi:hypothetical protein